ncbi:hypothetical protein BC829DRAFT_489778 [Chytridium lagenaria]|nr:hypothetical protein BC829DRAFT_489778 [Chytridium lagenaria]
MDPNQPLDGPSQAAAQKITACDNCYRLHRKCDGVSPRCNLCRKTQNECTYSRRFISTSAPKKSSKNDDPQGKQNKALKKRVDELEGTVQTLLNEIARMRTAFGTSESLASDGSPSILSTPSPLIPPISSSTPFILTPPLNGTPPLNSFLPYQFGMEQGGFQDMLMNMGVNNDILMAMVNTPSLMPGFVQPQPVTTLSFEQNLGLHPPTPSFSATSSVSPQSVDSTVLNSFDSAFNYSAPVPPTPTLPVQVDANLLAALEHALSFTRVNEDFGKETLIVKNEVSSTGLVPEVPQMGVKRTLLVGWAMENLGYNGEVPKVDFVERYALVKDFFDYLNRFPLPFVHEAHTLSLLTSNTLHPGLLYSIIAISLCLRASPDGSKWPFFGKQSERSKLFCGAAIAAVDPERPTLETAQTLALVAVYLFLFGDHRREFEYTGMVFKLLMTLLRLDVDPDVLEAQYPSGQKWTWLQKETRRRIFAGMCAFDALDTMHNEVSHGIWKYRHNVKNISTYELWRSVNIITGEPTITSTTNSHLDCSTCILSTLELLCKIHDHSSSPNPSDIDFNNLDVELKTWRYVLPDHLSLDFIMKANVFSAGFDLKGPYPFFGGLRLHLYHYASELLLHRSRLLREFARMARSANDGDALPELSTDGKESLKRCVDASAGIIALLRKRVTVVAPSPLPVDRSHPVAAFCTPVEARAVLECGLHCIVIVALLEGRTRREGRRRSLVDQRIKEVVEEFAGKDALGQAREMLGVAVVMLEGLAVRKARAGVLAETLERLVKQAGIEGLERKDVFGGGWDGEEWVEFDGLMI